ncbi:helix-turn-helix transcriptional regulator [Polaribacter haliotis]|uniref:Helix-turn-helix transcriptional regulator n=1 Tax=Polaribacter haliotis TaxID=1888915 RepID=A0A7L8ADF8_9FLAO|nr:AraC family transcriptional regulator [Polaribacter haliotis]QOD60035.1 helix-turn-helix transcriptional regulator [Polaribacter haliotis]
MIIRFKSSKLENEETVRSFNKDFEKSQLSEEEFTNFKKGVIGSVKEIHLNNAYMFFQDFDNETNEKHTLEIVNDQPVFLLQFVISGNVSFSIEDEASTLYTLNQNKYNLFYIPASKCIYKYINHKKKVLNIFFTETYLIKKMGACFVINSKKYKQSKKENQIYSFFNNGLTINSQLLIIVNEFLNCTFNGITKQSYLESKLTELVLIALATNNLNLITNKIREEDRENLIKTEQYIQANLKEELSIDKLSIMAGFNTSKFKSGFKEIYGLPVFKYITSLRIEKAIQLISNQNYTIAQASYEVGYKNPQHFTVAFKKKMGFLPSQLIK